MKNKRPKNCGVCWMWQCSPAGVDGPDVLPPELFAFFGAENIEKPGSPGGDCFCRFPSKKAALDGLASAIYSYRFLYDKEFGD